MKQTLEIDEITLQDRIHADVLAISKGLITDRASLEVMSNYTAQTFLVRFREHVLTQDIERKTYKIVEEPVFETPRHAYLASLPRRSFRRRFLGYFWGIDPENIPAKRRVHEVVADAFINYPDYRVPEHVGRVIFRNELQTESYWVGE